MLVEVMATKKTAPYGFWESPLQANSIAGAALSFSSPRVSPDGKIYFAEARPSGKTMIVEVLEDRFRDVLPEKYSAQSRVHEYGGAAFATTSDGEIVFTDFSSMIVYSLSPATGEVEAILDVPLCRYADFEPHPFDTALVYAIEEEHQVPDVPAKVVNRIVLIDVTSKTRKTIVEGNDFYMSPRLSPDGTCMAWTQFDHPDMPWIGAQLYVAKVDSAGNVSDKMHVAGKAGTYSICEPRFSLNGDLFFASDESGYYQVLQLREGGKAEVLKLAGLEQADIGSPEWQFGYRDYVFLSEDAIVATVSTQGSSKLIKIDTTTEKWEDLNIPLSKVVRDCLAVISKTSFIVVGSSDTEPEALYRVDLDAKSRATLTKLKSSLELPLSINYVSKPESITCPTTHDLVTHGFFYAPTSPHYQGPEGTKPPVIVQCHGGPTGAAPRSFDANTQYWTTRGYAVVLLNYRGSTGYGREYICQLNGAWGVADVEDAEAIVRYLGQQGLVDPKRAGITGGSAGGYTTIQALCASSLWAAGCSLFGISDLRSLLGETHKFESHYLQGLAFEPGMTEEQKEQRMKERSAMSHPERISGSLLLLQGSEDKIVPANQASALLNKARALGKDVEMIVFDGEGHGFKRADSKQRAIEEAEKLWRKHLVNV